MTLRVVGIFLEIFQTVEITPPKFDSEVSGISKNGIARCAPRARNNACLVCAPTGGISMSSTLKVGSDFTCSPNYFHAVFPVAEYNLLAGAKKGSLSSQSRRSVIISVHTDVGFFEL